MVVRVRFPPSVQECRFFDIKRKEIIMETLYFAFGVLTMVGVALASLTVYSVLKANQLAKQIRNQEVSFQELMNYIDETRRHAHDRIDRVEDYLPKAINDQITDAVTACNSYTDKRIDKLIDTYFMVKEAEKESKKLIKG